MNKEFGEGEIKLGDFHFAGDDAVVPFDVEPLDARGRTVQLGAALNSILGRHQYPDTVSCLLAEAMVLTVLLGTSLKFDGKFILQTSSDGPVSLLVCDFTTPSALRAYARFDEEALETAIKEGRTKPEELLGKGTLALTVDQGAHMQRYQGIVALDGSNLEEIARNYFAQSEQIPTNLRLGVAKLVERGQDGKPMETWRAGGLLVQFLPQSSVHYSADDDKNKEIQEDHWNEVKALSDTIESAELTDPQVSVEQLLFRLFHETGARVYDATPIRDQCSCSREKIGAVLKSFSAEEIAASVENGDITITCEFCDTHYHFDPKDFQKSGKDSGSVPA